MKKQQIIKLKQELPSDFLILGIAGTVPDSRLSWLLNKTMQIQLAWSMTAEEGLVKYTAEKENCRYVLLKNRHNGMLLHKKYKNILYFFVVAGCEIQWTELHKTLREEADITAVLELDKTSFTKTFIQQYFLL